MAKLSLRKKVIHAINEKGCLLLYPIDNKKEPLSIWSELYPKKKMVWDWNEDGGEEIAKLWHLKTELATSSEVVYLKWYSNRAIFMSKEFFTHLLAYFDTRNIIVHGQSAEALEILQADSPQSTKTLKEAMGLRGKFNESTYNKALRPLWDKLQIVAYGETDDGSFPSLNMAASELVFEPEWNASQNISSAKAKEYLIKKLGEKNLFWKYIEKVKVK